MIPHLKIALVTFCLFVQLGIASACPVCDTENGRQVREGIFNENFGRTLLAVIAPFPVVFVIVAAAYWMPELRRGYKRRNP